MTSYFHSLIQRDRQGRKHESWEGTLLDYLEIVKEKPQISMLAHERMYEILAAAGVEMIKTEDHPSLRWKKAPHIRAGRAVPCGKSPCISSQASTGEV